MDKEKHFSNKTSEQAFLACLLKKPSLLIKLPEMVYPEDFFEPEHSKIYSAIIPYISKNSLDLNLLLSKKDLDSKLLTELYSLKIDLSDIQEYHKKIIDSSIKRGILEAIRYADVRLSRENKAISTVVGELEKSIFERIQRASIGISPIEEDIHKLQEIINKRVQRFGQANKFIPENSTGFTVLDSLTKGFQKGDFWLIGGSTSDGKSELAIQLMLNVGLAGKPCLMFSCEMNKETILERMLSSHSKIPLSKIQTGELEESEKEVLKESGNKLSKLPIYIDDTSAPSFNTLIQRSKWMKVVNKDLGLIILDYIQLAIGSKGETREGEIASIGRTLKHIAKTLGVTTIGLSQLNTNVEERSDEIPPRLNDVRESKALTHDASIVLLLHLPNKYKKETNYDKSTVNLFLAKNRNGRTGIIKLKNRLDYQHFDEVLIEEVENGK